MPQRATSTSFRPGLSGNPRGRVPGTQNKRTAEARELCNQLIDDPEYRDALRLRLINGTAGAIETVLWHYAKGKPIDRIETTNAPPLARLSDDALKERLIAVMGQLEVPRATRRHSPQ